TLVALTLHPEIASSLVGGPAAPPAPHVAPLAPLAMRPIGVLRPHVAGEAIELNVTRLAGLLEVSPASLGRLGPGLRSQAQDKLRQALPAFQDRQLSGAQVRQFLGVVAGNLIGAVAAPASSTLPSLSVTSLDLLNRLDSRKTVTARVKARAGTLP